MRQWVLFGSLLCFFFFNVSSGARAQELELGVSLAVPPAEEAAHADRWMTALTERGSADWYPGLVMSLGYGPIVAALGAQGLGGDDGAIVAGSGALMTCLSFIVPYLVAPTPSAVRTEARYRWLSPDRRRAFVARLLREREAAWRRRTELSVAMLVISGVMSLAGAASMGEQNDTLTLFAGSAGASALMSALISCTLLLFLDAPLDPLSSERFLAGEEPE